MIRSAPISPTGSDSSRARSIGIALLVLFTALFFGGVLRGRAFYLLDFHQTFEPLRSVYSDAIQRGSILWSPRLGNGAPLLANPLYAAIYPPNLLLAPLPPAAALTLLTVLHVLWGSLGVWRLGRTWGFGSPGAWTAAVVFGFGGAAASATAFPNLCWTQAWLPWLLVAWHASTVSGVSPGRRVLPTLGLGLVAALMLSLADPFILVAGAIALAFLSLSEAMRRLTRERTGLVSLWVPTVSALILALLLTSPFLVAFGAYAPFSLRAMGFRPEGVESWSFHPALLLDALVSGPFGDPRVEGPGGFWAHAVAPDKGFPLFRGLYVGALALGLAALGALSRWRWRWVMLALAGAFLLLALGRYGPVYPFVSGLPLVRALRYPVKWALPLLLPLALLAGAGVRAVQEKSGNARARRAALGVLLAVAALLATLSILPLTGLDGWLVGLAGDATASGRLDAETRSAIRGGFVSAVGRAAIPVLLAVAAVWLRGARATGWVAALLAALVTLDLGFANQRLAPTVPGSFYSDVPEAIRVLRDESRDLGRVWIEDPLFASVRPIPRPESPVESFQWQRQVLMRFAGASYGLDLAFPQDTGLFAPVDYTRLRVLVESAPTREKLMLLGAAGVTHVVAYSLGEGPHLDRIALIPGRTDPPQVVWRNRLALPRARLVATLAPYEGDKGFIEAVRGHSEDLFQRVALVEIGDLRAHGIRPESLAPPVWDGTPASPGEVEWVEDRGSLLRLRTRGAAGYLVVSDVLLPGWTASVNGVETPLLRVDYSFRAVPLEAGEHEILMRYRVARGLGVGG